VAEGGWQKVAFVVVMATARATWVGLVATTSCLWLWSAVRLGVAASLTVVVIASGIAAMLRYTRPGSRLLSECMLLSGWLSGVALWLCYNSSTSSSAEGAGLVAGDQLLLWMRLSFFCLSSLPFLPMADANVDTGVLFFLSNDFQFKLATGATVWVIAMDCCAGFFSAPLQLSFLYGVTIVIDAVFAWAPLVGILLIDALKIQTPLFRRAAPVAIVSFLATAIVVIRWSAILDHANYTLINLANYGFGSPVTVTVQGQIASFLGRCVCFLSCNIFSLSHSSHPSTRWCGQFAFPSGSSALDDVEGSFKHNCVFSNADPGHERNVPRRRARSWCLGGGGTSALVPATGSSGLFAS
jgi:hypothetical protein